MRNIIVFSMLTLDGIIQGPGAPEEDTSNQFKHGGWVAPFGDAIYDEAVREELKPADYLLGRITFEIWEEYWPRRAEQWPGINEGRKYVLSTRRNASAWKHTAFITSIQDIVSLKNSSGSALHVWGSSQLVHLLLAHDLVDELRLKIHPVLLGKGKRLFDEGSVPGTYELLHQQVTTTGVILANYRRAGMVLTGRADE